MAHQPEGDAHDAPEGAEPAHADVARRCTTLARAIGAGVLERHHEQVPRASATRCGTARGVLDGYGERKNGVDRPPVDAGTRRHELHARPASSTGQLWRRTSSTSTTPASAATRTSATSTWRASAIPRPSPSAVRRGSVFRFFNTKNGSHFYTASSRRALTSSTATMSGTYRFEGTVLHRWTRPIRSTRPPCTASSTRRTGSHFYTASAAERDDVQGAPLLDLHVRGRGLQGLSHAREGRRGGVPLLQQEERDPLLHRLGRRA